MAKNKNAFEKHRKEMEKKRKAQEKRERRFARRASAGQPEIQETTPIAEEVE